MRGRLFKFWPRASRLVWVLTILLFISASLSPLLSANTAHAVGSPIFTYKSSSYSGGRTTQSTIELKARFEIAEDGIRDTSLGWLTVNLSLSLGTEGGDKDAWKVSKISFSDPSPSLGENNASASGSTITIKGERFNFSGNGYGFEYRKGLDGSISGLLILKDGSPIGPGNSSKNEHPVSAFQFAANEHYSGAGALYALPVDNYGNPGTQGGKTQYSNWLGQIRSVRITVDENATDIPPPYVSISEDTSVGRPKLKFILKLSEIEGSWLVSSHKWLLFEASQISGSSSTIISGLYFITDDDANNNYFLFAPGVSTDNIIASGMNTGGPYVLNPPGSLSVQDDDVIKVFGYLMDVPKNGKEDCADGNFYKTGPSGTDGKTVPDIQGKFSDATKENASNLNINCFDKSSTGWPAKWGIKNTDVSASGCGVSLWNLFTGEASTLITKAVSCIVGGAVKSLLGPVGEGAKKLAGETETLESRLKKNDDGLVKAWKYSLTLVNVLVILALLVIAFANVFHLNLNTYAAKKALPGLVLGVIGANASLLVMRFVLDIVQALMNLAYGMANTNDLSELLAKFIEVLGAGGTSLPLGVQVFTSFFAVALIIVGVLYFLFLVVMFAFAMIKRIVWLYFLIVIAPLAFVSYGIPTMSQWFTKWWDQFLRQAFVLPVLFLAMALFINVMDKLGLKPDLNSLNTENPGVGLFTVVLAFAGATMILKLPGAITKGAYDLAAMSKKAFGAAKNAPAQAWGGVQGAAGWRSRSLGAQAKALEAQHAAAVQRGDFARARAINKRMSSLQIKSERYGTVGKAAGAARGRAYILANPDKTIVPWWKSRTEAGERAHNLEAVKVGVGVPGKALNLSDMVSGAAGGYAAKYKVAKDLASEIKTIDGINKFLTEGPVGKITEAAKAYEEKLINDNGGYTDAARTQLSAGAAKALSDFRAEVIEASKTEKAQAVMDKIGVKGASLFAQGSFTAGYGQKLVIIRQQRGGKKIKNLVADWDEVEVQGMNTPRGGRRRPYAEGDEGGSQGGGALNVNVVGGTINKINDIGLSANEIGEASSRLAAIQQHSGALRENIDEISLNSLNRLSKDLNTDDVIEKLSGEQSKILQSQLSSLVEPGKAGGSELLTKIGDAFKQGSGDALRGVVQDIAIAANNRGDFEGMERHLANSLAAGQALNQANESASHSFTPESQGQLRQHIENGNETEIAKVLESTLTPTLNNLNQTLGRVGNPQVNQEVFKQMARELVGLRETMTGRGPRGFSRIIETMGSRLGKQLDVAHLSLGSQMKQAAANQPEIIVQAQPQAPTVQPQIAPEVNVNVENQPVPPPINTVDTATPEMPSTDDQTPQS